MGALEVPLQSAVSSKKLGKSKVVSGSKTGDPETISETERKKITSHLDTLFASQADPEYPESAYHCTFTPGDEVFVKVKEGDCWIRTRVSKLKEKKVTRWTDKLGVLAYHVEGHKGWYAPLKGEIKPANPDIEDLLVRYECLP
ncbi:hypothetical protein BDN72DRAFT_957870 [Pluteus cervinus]|uniref:Uncharacterized protein n=1 Tax=Pluteus cervinus TaxID=181527 RepID=A0ACD3B0B9_9AGAR|nr:hypothetical protein BDN72DRAFT_957870 [Pluteus cervinus]